MLLLICLTWMHTIVSIFPLGSSASEEAEDAGVFFRMLVAEVAFY